MSYTAKDNLGANTLAAFLEIHGFESVWPGSGKVENPRLLPLNNMSSAGLTMDPSEIGGIEIGTGGGYKLFDKNGLSTGSAEIFPSSIIAKDLAHYRKRTQTRQGEYRTGQKWVYFIFVDGSDKTYNGQIIAAKDVIVSRKVCQISSLTGPGGVSNDNGKQNQSFSLIIPGDGEEQITIEDGKIYGFETY